MTAGPQLVLKCEAEAGAAVAAAAAAAGWSVLVPHFLFPCLGNQSVMGCVVNKLH